MIAGSRLKLFWLLFLPLQNYVDLKKLFLAYSTNNQLRQLTSCFQIFQFWTIIGQESSHGLDFFLFSVALLQSKVLECYWYVGKNNAICFFQNTLHLGNLIFQLPQLFWSPFCNFGTLTIYIIIFINYLEFLIQ